MSVNARKKQGALGIFVILAQGREREQKRREAQTEVCPVGVVKESPRSLQAFAVQSAVGGWGEAKGPSKIPRPRHSSVRSTRQGKR